MVCSSSEVRAPPVTQPRDVLGGLLRRGAQQLLAQAIEAEVAEWIDGHSHVRNDAGHRQVVRIGEV